MSAVKESECAVVDRVLVVVCQPVVVVTGSERASAYVLAVFPSPDPDLDRSVHVLFSIAHLLIHIVHGACRPLVACTSSPPWILSVLMPSTTLQYLGLNLRVVQLLASVLMPCSTTHCHLSYADLLNLSEAFTYVAT